MRTLMLTSCLLLLASVTKCLQESLHPTSIDTLVEDIAHENLDNVTHPHPLPPCMRHASNK